MTAQVYRVASDGPEEIFDVYVSGESGASAHRWVYEREKRRHVLNVPGFSLRVMRFAPRVMRFAPQVMRFAPRSRRVFWVVYRSTRLGLRPLASGECSTVRGAKSCAISAMIAWQRQASSP